MSGTKKNDSNRVEKLAGVRLRGGSLCYREDLRTQVGWEGTEKCSACCLKKIFQGEDVVQVCHLPSGSQVR